VRADSYQFPDGNKIHFYQTHLKLCYAVTAHKSQDQTLSRVAMSIMDPAFAHDPLYVALSRVRRISDLILFGTDEFPEHGPGLRLNRSIQEMDRSIEEQDES
jgi:ATP-dependent exoDNAse (exonuclease V) alpha subunit